MGWRGWPKEEERCVAVKIESGERCRQWRRPNRETCPWHPDGSVRFDESNVDPQIAARARAVLGDE